MNKIQRTFAGLCATALPALARASPPTTSAYATDPQYTHVQDATSDSIGTVNMIMCIMHALRPDALVNENTYLALVDQAKCDSKSQPSASNLSAGGSASQAVSYTNVVVSSIRATNDDPMRVKVWLEDRVTGASARSSSTFPRPRRRPPPTRTACSGSTSAASPT